MTQNDRVLAAARAVGRDFTTADIVEATGLKSGFASRSLSTLVDKGYIDRLTDTGKGAKALYRVSPDAPEPVDEPSREDQVAELLSREVSVPVIAERLGISKSSVFAALSRIRRRLGWQAQ